MDMSQGHGAFPRKPDRRDPVYGKSLLLTNLRLMTPERWRYVRELVESTVELGPVERESLLGARCAGDADLRSEVESLLGAYYAGYTLDRPAFDLGLEILTGATPWSPWSTPSRDRLPRGRARSARCAASTS